MHATTAGFHLLARSVLRHPPIKLTVVSKDLASVLRNHDVSMLDVNAARFLPIQQVDYGSRRPMTHVEIIEYNAFAKVDIPKLITVTYDSSFR